MMHEAQHSGKAGGIRLGRRGAAMRRSSIVRLVGRFFRRRWRERAAWRREREIIAAGKSWWGLRQPAPALWERVHTHIPRRMVRRAPGLGKEGKQKLLKEATESADVSPSTSFLIRSTYGMYPVAWTSSGHRTTCSCPHTFWISGSFTILQHGFLLTLCHPSRQDWILGLRFLNENEIIHFLIFNTPMRDTCN